jgi:ribosomal protein S18 acetylase RimI-like enzyme
MDIEYSLEENVSPEEFVKLLESSGLAERRPVGDPDRIEKMIRTANLVITARFRGELIGIARSLSDFAFCTYLSDLAVDKKYQKMGIGKELIRLTSEKSGPAKLILLSAPAATGYYPRIGMKNHPFCFFIDSPEELK